MNANIYNIEGKNTKQVELPAVFKSRFEKSLVTRALLAEQSLRYQPQGHNVMAGMNTTAAYIGEYSTYRTGRHMGIAVRPRQKLAGGAMGAVRRIPSAVKGRRAHPHKIDKITVEKINAKEYRKALSSAIAGTTKLELVAERAKVTEKMQLPIVFEDSIEKVAKAKDLVKILNVLGLKEDLQASHDPKNRKGLRRSTNNRRFRKSVLLVVSNEAALEKAGRNIPGIDVARVDMLRVEKVAPGSIPRLTIWSESALGKVASAIEKARL